MRVGFVCRLTSSVRIDPEHPRKDLAVTRTAPLAGRYERIAAQLEELFTVGPKATDDAIARMASICALLHHKMPHFFWTGFYLLKDGKLVVGPYQGPLACAVLPGPDGVCWAVIRREQSIIVPDVSAYPGHVACDDRSRSEIVMPLRGANGDVIGTLDVDSHEPDAFGEVDRVGLEIISTLVHL